MDQSRPPFLILYLWFDKALQRPGCCPQGPRSITATPSLGLMQQRDVVLLLLVLLLVLLMVFPKVSEG